MLIFLYNELLSPQRRDELRVPLTFISYAYVEAKLYSHYGNYSHFAIQGMERRSYSNPYVYGALFHLSDSGFYARIMDAYHQCSMSTLHKNHKLDVHHRIRTLATPISFHSLDELGRMMYKEKEGIESNVYVGNPNHAKISNRLRQQNSYRILDGVDKRHFTKLYEVEHG